MAVKKSGVTWIPRTCRVELPAEYVKPSGSSPVTAASGAPAASSVNTWGETGAAGHVCVSV